MEPPARPAFGGRRSSALAPKVGQRERRRRHCRKLVTAAYNGPPVLQIPAHKRPHLLGGVAEESRRRSSSAIGAASAAVASAASGADAGPRIWPVSAPCHWLGSGGGESKREPERAIERARAARAQSLWWARSAFCGPARRRPNIGPPAGSLGAPNAGKRTNLTRPPMHPLRQSCSCWLIDTFRPGS